jgi:hypothetical protein
MSLGAGSASPQPSPSPSGDGNHVRSWMDPAHWVGGGGTGGPGEEEKGKSKRVSPCIFMSES